LEQKKEDIPKCTIDDIKNLKPKWITTYCGCRCVEVTPYGGKFEVCQKHKEKFNKEGSGVVVPKVKIDIPISYWERLKIKVTR